MTLLRISACDELASMLSQASNSSSHVPVTLRAPSLASDLSPLSCLPDGIGALGAFYDLEDREGLFGLGVCQQFTLEAPSRLAELDEEIERALAQSPPLHAGWLGGHRFDLAQASSREWSSFGAAQFILPLLFLEASSNSLTLGAHLDGDPKTAERAFALLERWRHAPRSTSSTSSLDLGQTDIETQFRAQVGTALLEIEAGNLEKVVLARTAEATIDQAWSPLPLLSALAQEADHGVLYGFFPTADSERGFLGCTPETLYRRIGTRLHADALAGSIRTDSDVGTNARLAESLLASGKDRREHSAVVEALRESLRDRAADICAPEKPTVRKMGAVQHLYTPVTATLHRPDRLLAALHPTPAVCGTPTSAARAIINLAEGFDRGWYSGSFGWIRAQEERFAVALRGALFDRPAQRLIAYAGAGIVQGSQPSSELEETICKLGAVNTALALAGAKR